MKTISVSARSKTLYELLKKARRKTLILETTDGERFALAPIANWNAFDVGDDQDFAVEVERTGKNKKLMRTLAERRKREAGERMPLAAVKKLLKIE